MSAANSAAKKRRAGVIDTPQPTTAAAAAPSPVSSGLTIHQVVALFDKRLSILEKTVTDFIQTYTEEVDDDVVTGGSGSSTVTQEAINDIATSSKEMMDEFGARFEMLADEIDTMKNTVLTLQTYTLSVNKMLLESNGKFRNIPNIAMNK